MGGKRFVPPVVQAASFKWSLSSSFTFLQVPVVAKKTKKQTNKQTNKETNMTLGFFFLGPSGYYFPPKSFPQKTLEPTWPQDVGMLNPARDKNKNKNEIKTKKEPNKIYETKACPPTLKLRAPLRLHLHAFKKKTKNEKGLV